MMRHGQNCDTSQATTNQREQKEDLLEKISSRCQQMVQKQLPMMTQDTSVRRDSNDVMTSEKSVHSTLMDRGADGGHQSDTSYGVQP